MPAYPAKFKMLFPRRKDYIQLQKILTNGKKEFNRVKWFWA